MLVQMGLTRKCWANLILGVAIGIGIGIEIDPVSADVQSFTAKSYYSSIPSIDAETDPDSVIRA
jgi:hypothetical protein